MKTKIHVKFGGIIYLVCFVYSLTACVTLAFFENDPPEVFIAKQLNSIPLQAGICDIMGVGRVTNTWANGKGVVIAVDNYWHGDPGHDSLSIPMETHQPPVTNTPLVFFLSEREGFNDGAMGAITRYRYVLDPVKRSTKPFRPEGLVFFHNERSWFHVNETNADLVEFSSNLVVAAQSCNTNAFYEIIRDGYRLNPESSRIWEDSYFGMQGCEFYFTTNFMAQIWPDPLLVKDQLNIFYNSYFRMTEIWLP